MATITLFPNGAGSVHYAYIAGIIGNYTALDDYSESDYVYVSGSSTLSDSGKDSYTLQDTALSGAITNVRLYTRFKIWGGFGGQCYSLLYTHGTEYQSQKGNAQYLDWTTFTDDFAVNPYTGSAWTWQEINDLQAGCNLATAKAGSTFCGFVYVVVTYNPPPNTPSIPSGSQLVGKNASNSYSSAATDPDGDNVKLRFDWGDTTTSDSDFVASGQTVNLSHSWATPGTYQVKVKSYDVLWQESGWSSTLQVLVISTTCRARIIGSMW